MANAPLLGKEEKDVSIEIELQNSGFVTGEDQVNLKSLLENDKNNINHSLLDEIDEKEEDDDDVDVNVNVEGRGLLGKKTRSGTQGAGLKKQLSLLHAVSIMVGGMIGSGIFISPRFVLIDSGSVGMALIVWTACGLVALLGALCYCELGTVIGKSGGEYIYLKTAFGPLPAYMFSWADVWFMRPVSFAIIALTFANYLTRLFGFGEQLSCRAEAVVKLTAAVCICTVTVINCVSVRLAARVQVFFTATKLCAIVVLVVTGLTKLAQGHTESFQAPFKGSSNNLGQIGQAFYSGLWAYNGWNQLNLTTEELKDPQKTLPMGVFIAIPLVTVCYLTTNVAYLAILSPYEMAHSSAVAVLASSKASSILEFLMPLFVASSCFGAINGTSFVTGRTLFSMAREGQIPPCLAMLHTRFGTPLPAIVFRGSLALLMLIPSDVSVLISWFGFGIWIFYLATFVSMIVLRFKLPNKPRPYKVHASIPTIMILVSVYFVLVPFLDKPLDSVYGLCIILVGIPVYFVLVKGTNAPSCVSRIVSKLTVWLQLLCSVAEPSSE